MQKIVTSQTQTMIFRIEILDNSIYIRKINSGMFIKIINYYQISTTNIYQKITHFELHTRYFYIPLKKNPISKLSSWSFPTLKQESFQHYVSEYQNIKSMQNWNQIIEPIRMDGWPRVLYWILYLNFSRIPHWRNCFQF